MKDLLHIIDTGDVCALGLLILITIIAGAAMIGANATLKLWGQRIAAGAFVLYFIYGFAQFEPSNAEDWVYIAFRGVLAAGLALGPSWIVLSIVGFVYEHYLKMSRVAHARAVTRKHNREQRREQRRQSQQQTAEPLSPEKEEAVLEAEREAEEQRRREVQRQIELSKRREEAIAACEVLFHLRAPDIGNRFSREQFDEFVKKYMGEGKPIEVIEDRAGDLQQLIQQHYESVHPPMRFTDLSALTAWYERQREQIRSLSIKDVYKKDFLIRLNERYAELTQETLENLS